ncbi:hypothetical protein DPMN_026838 [Dreissena polymorpha]|uniref:Uncharacterized protein n=1 Tax=Dreissena polymorpha TaxID=45954 RepID=A0A9D4RCY5_DREPO|nr:hypothetical protein DPMN_026838 [Dreissena polymorpha]
METLAAVVLTGKNIRVLLHGSTCSYCDVLLSTCGSGLVETIPGGKDNNLCCCLSPVQAVYVLRYVRSHG